MLRFIILILLFSSAHSAGTQPSHYSVEIIETDNANVGYNTLAFTDEKSSFVKTGTDSFYYSKTHIKNEKYDMGKMVPHEFFVGSKYSAKVTGENKSMVELLFVTVSHVNLEEWVVGTPPKLTTSTTIQSFPLPQTSSKHEFIHNGNLVKVLISAHDFN